MRIFYLILICLFPIQLFAQKIKRVEGNYTYRAPENVTIEHAKYIALERAQIEAIASTFGTNISQHNLTRVSNSDGQSNVNFLSLSSSDVKGEWIETIGTPTYEISYEQDMLIINCKVKGVVREIITAEIDIRAKVLRNGTEDRFEASEFRSGDNIYLSFQSPVDGYLVIYLVDDNKAYCLLPYRNQAEGIYEVKANTAYTFFSESLAPVSEHYYVDEYELTCQKDNETNHIYLLFSPIQFIKANDKKLEESLPRELTLEAFQKWYSKQKQINSNFYTKHYLLTIKH